LRGTNRKKTAILHQGTRGESYTLIKPVVIIQHAPHEHPALIKRALDGQFITNSILHSFEHKSYPKHNDISGLVSLGGPMSANDEDDHSWILDETFLMKRCFEAKKPILGICLGGQMLARALGGRVTQNLHPEIGWYPLEKTTAGETDLFFSQLAPSPAFYQWHYDTFHLPKDAKLLAKSRICDRQAYSIGENSYGLQFHPEVDHQLIQEWLDTEGTDEEILLARMAHPHDCVQEPREHLRKAAEHQLESVLFAALMTQLFNPRVFNGSSTAALTLLDTPKDQAWVIELKDPASEKAFQILGRVLHRRQTAQGIFLFFREFSGLLWPIREDYINKVEKFNE
jgi:GMP synthase (glutamine-hydrolysing)